MRKRMPFIAVCLLLSGQLVFAQAQYEVTRGRNGEKILKGLITRDIVEKDTAFNWFAENQKGYTPHVTALSALKTYGDSIQLIAFMGTWCEDSHFVIPKFFMIGDAAGFSKDRLTLIGVDRSKTTLSHLAEALNIINVPTLIVMKDGKEVGRVVEYGKYGMWDKELGEIIQSAFSK